MSAQAPGGGFNASPPGNWIAIKIFIGEGEQEAEVFVNFNTIIGKGQFSIAASGTYVGQLVACSNRQSSHVELLLTQIESN